VKGACRMALFDPWHVLQNYSLYVDPRKSGVPPKY
jgi:hypothetical protein